MYIEKYLDTSWLIKHIFIIQRNKKIFRIHTGHSNSLNFQFNRQMRNKLCKNIERNIKKIVE